MKKILTILCCTFIFFTQSKGQSDTITGDYIVLYSGKIIQSEVVTYKNSYFHAGDKKYKDDEVSLYRNADGSFANTKHMAIRKKKARTNFYKAESLGKVNIYSNTFKAEIDLNSINSVNRPQMVNVSKTSTYYNKGMESLKKAKYRNLKKDIGDNPNCTKTLRQYRIIKASPLVLWPMSLGSAAVAFAVAINEPFENRFLNRYAPWVVPFALNYMANYADRVLSAEKAKKALEIYNQ
jgi:hypothetical protein